MTLFLQRFFDMVFSGMALIVLSPLFTIVIIILKFTGEGEIFFFKRGLEEIMYQ